MSKPYVFINDRIQTYFTLKTRVGGGAKFDVLNAHIRNVVVMPGQLVIVSNGSTGTLTVEEIELMNLARNVHRQVKGAGSQLIDNYDLLQNILSYGSLGIGAATGSWGKHLEGVKTTLEDIERLYKLSLARGTPIARQEFINQRRVLFATLDTQLESIARWGTGLHKKRAAEKDARVIDQELFAHRGYTGVRRAHRQDRQSGEVVEVGNACGDWAEYIVLLLGDKRGLFGRPKGNVYESKVRRRRETCCGRHRRLARWFLWSVGRGPVMHSRIWCPYRWGRRSRMRHSRRHDCRIRGRRWR
jgi:hypothetical protein